MINEPKPLNISITYKAHYQGSCLGTKKLAWLAKKHLPTYTIKKGNNEKNM
jgi:hypothetical protein